MARSSVITNRILERLRQNLADGVWKPGDTIPSENELARLYDVSRSSVHLAIQKLVDVGILESRQGRGTAVHAFSEEELKTRLYRISFKDAFSKVTELRLMIEPDICLKVAPYIDEETLARLDGYIDLMVKNMDKPALRARYDVLFHRTILETCGNELVVRSFDMISEEIKYNNIRYSADAGILKSADYHHAIVEMLRARDGEGAQALMIEHLLWTDDCVKKAT